MDRDECYKFKVLPKFPNEELERIEPVSFINKKMIIGFTINEMIGPPDHEDPSIENPRRLHLPIDNDVSPFSGKSVFSYEAGLTLVGDRSFYIRDKNIDNLLMKLQDYDIFVHRTGDSMHPSEVKKYCENCKVLEYCKENDIRPSKCRKCLMCFEASNFIQKEEKENGNNMSNVIS